MPKSSLIALVGSVVACAAAVLLFAENTKLRKQVETLEVEVVRYRDTTSRSSQGGSGQGATAEVRENDGELADAGAIAKGKFTTVALQKILAQRDPSQRLRALLDYVDGLAISEIPAALIALRAKSPEWDPDAKAAAALMLRRWGDADSEGALEHVESLGLKKGGGDAAIVLSAIAAADPQRAIEWLQNPENKLAHVPWMGHIFAGTITKEWMRTDPDAALAWAQTVPDNQRTGAYIGVLGTLAADDPARAASLASTLESDKARTDVMGQIAKAWSEQSPASAMLWASGLEGDERKRAVGEVLEGWAQNEPAAAAEYVATLSQDGQEATYVERVASTWSRKEPAAAAEWLVAQAQNDRTPAAMGQVMWNWTVADPQAASTWLVDQPPGEVRDSAVGALAKATFDSDPEGAVSWAATISNQGQRSATLERGVRTWIERDEVAAREWIDNTKSLTPEEVQKFTAPAGDATTGEKG